MLTAERFRELLDYDPDTGIFRWRVDRRGKAKAGDIAGCENQGYIKIKVDGKRYLAQRLAWLHVTGKWPDNEVDHRDLDGLNNRFGNLRDATHGQNQRNTRAKGRLGIKGVCRHQGKYLAQIRVNGKNKSLGVHATPELAHAAYCAAAKQHFGEYARAA